MNEDEKNRSLSYITNSAKDEKGSEKLKNIVLSVLENRIFKRLLKYLKTMKTMNLLTH